MNHQEIATDLLAHLPFAPNYQQMQVALALARFCFPELEGLPQSDRVFVLNGYAGTGKTSLIGALVKTLAAARRETVLLAPTGRAAKVFGAYAGRPASTIHRRIYRHVLPGQGGQASPRENTSRGAIFIVDEASMIASASPDGDRDILRDLLFYVYSGENCRLILVGDTAQLPPVGQENSPGMDSDELRGYGLKVTRATLTDVARQTALSGILANATALRRSLTLPDGSDAPIVPMTVTDSSDCFVTEGADLPDLLASLYGSDGIDDTIMITRSNRSAVDFNRGIRSLVLGYEEELTRGDLLIAAKNNYFWTRGIRSLDFIANGEILEIDRVVGTEQRYGLRFADVIFKLPGDTDVSFAAKIVLDALTSPAVALERPEMEKLFRGVYEDPELHAPEASHADRIRAMQASPYWNALQMKYAYAVTCHKAQGGQWRNVVIDLGYIPPDMCGREFNRWLYTAVTRSTTNLYFLNPPEQLVK